MTKTCVPSLVGAVGARGAVVLSGFFARLPTQTDHLFEARIVGRHAERLSPIPFGTGALDNLLQSADLSFQDRNAR